MKYVLYDQKKNGDLYTEEFDTKEEAIRCAKWDWNMLCISDREGREAFFVLESENPDKEAPNHLDGTPVFILK